ncbi:MAG: heat-inducible transcriptional repressor HrcA [Lachnospiraceae bacterium]|nr:heat-inducible transcriptional repressor HrcA [Lachnospiraceae bacterium]
MELDDRKVKILQAIIKNYLETGEPVGSRTISKFSDLNLSSATIRNEMADLEELGYIIQPHTSAGRIPSDKGYRFYVDTLMEAKVEEINNMKADLEEKADKIENLLKHVAKLLAVNTNYATMVTTPKYRSRKCKFIQLTEIDEKNVLAVIVLEGNIVKNKMIQVDEYLDKEIVLKLNLVMNSFLQGLDLEEINLGIVQKLKEQSGEHEKLVSDILDAVAKAMQEEGDIEVYTSGVTNMLSYPELNDGKDVKDLIFTLEDKKELAELVDQDLEYDSEDSINNGRIQVYIGNETPIDSMKNCSVVTATYELENGVYGKVGIIGPKRMDYEKVVGTLKNLMSQLDDIFRKK